MKSPSQKNASDTSFGLVYLAPDLTDPAVSRRVKMLVAGGATVSTGGFVRGFQTSKVEEAIVLGRTHDAALFHRVLAVIQVLARPRRLTALVRGQQVVLARNLEMLLIAKVAIILGNSRAKLIYECLDVHRVMLGEGLKSKFLRWIESALLVRSRLILVSSPAFVREYFDKRHPGHPPTVLVENKMLRLDPEASPSSPALRRSPPPWRIGWFGMIRCRRSLDILKRLAADLNGQLEVVIRGRPTMAVFPDFVDEIAVAPNIRFGGEYAASELPTLYGEVDFVWAIDFYEEGQNSSWLLPNRLYEGGAFDKPALAQGDVEAGRWLAAAGSGVVLADPSAELEGFLKSLDASSYASLVSAARNVPRTALVCDRAACVTLVKTLFA